MKDMFMDEILIKTMDLFFSASIIKIYFRIYKIYMSMLNNHITLPIVAKASCSGALKKYIYINHISINQLIKKKPSGNKEKKCSKKIKKEKEWNRYHKMLRTCKKWKNSKQVFSQSKKKKTS
jgi:hypothetical protein